MSRRPIEDLSVIMERKPQQQSQQTFDQSRPIYNIKCPINNRENYQCIICNRLRKVCPYTQLPHCQHQNRGKAVYQSDYYVQKNNISTLPGERMRTFSNDAYRHIEHSRNRQEYVNNPQITHNQTQINIPTSEELIYYPVIHNRFVVSPTVEKSSNLGTPNRQKKSRRVDYDYSNEDILTPTMIKELIYSNK